MILSYIACLLKNLYSTNQNTHFENTQPNSNQNNNKFDQHIQNKIKSQKKSLIKLKNKLLLLDLYKQLLSLHLLLAELSD